MDIIALTKKYIDDVTATAKSTSTKKLKTIIESIETNEFISELKVNDDLKILLHIFQKEFDRRDDKN